MKSKFQLGLEMFFPPEVVEYLCKLQKIEYISDELLAEYFTNKANQDGN